jgi:predicted nucleic acid-binding protein
VTGESGAVPLPYVFDTSACIGVARSDARVMELVLNLSAQERTVHVPVLALAAASLDSRSDDAAEMLEGLELFGNVQVTPLEGWEQALRLATVISKTGLDPWDAHVAMVADEEICPILTLDPAKWNGHLTDLGEPLHIMEIAEPEDG